MSTCDAGLNKCGRVIFCRGGRPPSSPDSPGRATFMWEAQFPPSLHPSLHPGWCMSLLHICAHTNTHTFLLYNLDFSFHSSVPLSPSMEEQWGRDPPPCLCRAAAGERRSSPHRRGSTQAEDASAKWSVFVDQEAAAVAIMWARTRRVKPPGMMVSGGPLRTVHASLLFQSHANTHTHTCCQTPWNLCLLMGIQLVYLRQTTRRVVVLIEVNELRVMEAEVWPRWLHQGRSFTQLHWMDGWMDGWMNRWMDGWMMLTRVSSACLVCLDQWWSWALPGVPEGVSNKPNQV